MSKAYKMQIIRYSRRLAERNNACEHCGALMPSDLAFQEEHMRRMHGLVV
jgi:hypothetical protein